MHFNHINGDHMAGWYELTKSDKGRFSFVLKAGNNEVVLRSEQYESKAAAQLPFLAHATA